MCGAAGATTGDRAWVERALDRVAHRGPDARGVAEAPGALHGHVRLAILDLDARSDQPYRVPGGTLSYVGECWNHLKLRADLERDGVTFLTEGDTEVVARLLERDGPDLAARALRGQYALAWTDRDGETTLLRDRLGEMPLYLLQRPGDLLSPPGVEWASERRAWDPPDAALARPVPAGTLVRLTAAGPVEDRYYAPPDRPRRSSRSFGRRSRTGSGRTSPSRSSPAAAWTAR
jgi:asparagine synthase (glutamine-hydrolysing)